MYIVSCIARCSGFVVVAIPLIFLLLLTALWTYFFYLKRKTPCAVSLFVLRYLFILWNIFQRFKVTIFTTIYWAYLNEFNMNVSNFSSILIMFRFHFCSFCTVVRWKSMAFNWKKNASQQLYQQLFLFILPYFFCQHFFTTKNRFKINW